jgi:hypothetical protein
VNKYTTVSIPRTLHQRIEKLIEKKSGFKSVSDYVTYVLREKAASYLTPPITVLAWMVMLTGKNPGKLGIYGFRHRRGYSYTEGYIVNSTNVRSPAVWDVLAA